MITTDYFSLYGKTALVTGCSSGIGEAMAIGLAEAGANIIGVSGTIAMGSNVEKEVAKLNRNFSFYAFDLGDRCQIYDGIKKIKSAHSTIDILINNAGIILRDPAAKHTDEEWDKVLAVNLDAPFVLTREFGKKMLERKSGKIIFNCSLLSFRGGINVPGYTASKSAVAGLVKAFANEWASKGINVNGIAPGIAAKYAVLYANASSSAMIENINIENSTFYSFYYFVRQDGIAGTSLNINNCTFNDMINNGGYFVNYSGTFPTTFTISNSILGSIIDPTNANGIKSTGNAIVSGTYQTSDCVFSANPITGATSYTGTAADLFTAPANGDFAIKDNSFAGKSTAGDPRWR